MEDSMATKKTKLAAQAASPSTLTKAEKRKADRDRRTILTAAFRIVRDRDYEALTEDEQNAITTKVDDAIREYNTTMESAQDAADSELMESLRTLATEHGYNVIESLLHDDWSLTEYPQDFPAPNLETAFQQEVHEDANKRAELLEAAKALAATGTIADGGVVFPDDNEPEPDGGGGEAMAATA
jgi:L-lactate utilization protein LutC